MNEIQDTTSSSFIFSGEMNDSWTFSDHKEIASRGANILFSATHQGCRYLLKGLKPEFRNNPTYQLQMLKEYRLGKSLKHEHVVQIFDMVDDEVAGKCIVMEFVDGCNLRQWLDSNRQRSKRHKVFMEILEGLAYCHAKQVTHCDIKPSNIMVTTKGENVKLIDFGLSDNDNYLIFKQSGGTRDYMAPEQHNSEMMSDSRTDIYALGCLMGEIFPGRYLLLRKHCKRYKQSRRVQSVVSLKKRYLAYRGLPWVLLSVVIMVLLLLLAASNSRPKEVQPISVIVHDTITVDQEKDTVPAVEVEESPAPSNPDVTQVLAERLGKIYETEIRQCLENESYNYDIDSELRRRCTMATNNCCTAANEHRHAYIRKYAEELQGRLNEQYNGSLHQCRIAIVMRNR